MTSPKKRITVLGLALLALALIWRRATTSPPDLDGLP